MRLWSVTGTYYIWNQSGKVTIPIDETIAAHDSNDAITKATDEAFLRTGSTELYDETTAEVTAVELAGERLAQYERIQAELYSQQYGIPLFPPSANAVLADGNQKED